MLKRHEPLLCSCPRGELEEARARFGEPATWASLVKLGIGVLFALLALEQCRPGSPAEPNGSPAALSRSGGQLGWGTILM